MRLRFKYPVVEVEQFVAQRVPWPRAICRAILPERGCVSEPHIHVTGGILRIQDGEWIVQGAGGSWIASAEAIQGYFDPHIGSPEDSQE